MSIEFTEPIATGSPSAPAGLPASGTTASGSVDVQAVAERVYRLMLADLRLGFARGERPSSQTGEGG
jgi:hypothetical protein